MVEHNYLEEDKNIVDLSDESSEGEEATLAEEQIFRIGGKEVHVSYDSNTGEGELCTDKSGCVIFPGESYEVITELLRGLAED